MTQFNIPDIKYLDTRLERKYLFFFSFSPQTNNLEVFNDLTANYCLGMGLWHKRGKRKL